MVTMLTHELPRGWQQAVLRDLLISIESGSRPRGGVRDITEGIPSLGGEHLDPFGDFDFTNTRFVPEEYYRRMRRGKIRLHDVLVVKDGATTGKVSLVDSDFPFPEAAINEHLFLLRSRTDVIDQRYLFWYLFSTEGQAQIRTNFRGSAQGGINQSFVDNFWIPFPSLNEQRRIVARIEELFARIEEARRLRAAADQDAERLMPAALEEVFEEAEPKGWPIKTVGDIIEGKPQYGTSQKASEEPVGAPILRMGNIVDGQVSFDDLKYIDLSPDEEAKYILHEGDVLFNRTNSAKLVGKSAVYPGGRRAVFASYLIRVVADQRKAMPHFVVAYINSPLGRQYIQSQLTRAIGQVNVNAKKLQAMPIPVPPLLEQRRIVEHLEAVQAQVAELKHLQTESAAELERLEQAILARAFRGEL
jgi:type I restriction enzyme S subunit